MRLSCSRLKVDVEPVRYPGESVLNSGLEVDCHDFRHSKDLDLRLHKLTFERVSKLVLDLHRHAVGGGVVDHGQKLVLLTIHVIGKEHESSCMQLTAHGNPFPWICH